MRRADRLFEIIQFMRRNALTRARDLGNALEVSERTIYRDIQDLIASGVPIEGEAGVGYVLKAGFDLPPLMFTEAEIEALVLGARIVESWADAELATAASNVIAKVEAVIPDRLRSYMANTALLAPPHHYMEPVKFDMAELREDFRTFRLDRIDGFEICPDRFRAEPGRTLHDFLKRDQTWTRRRASDAGNGKPA